MSSGEEEENEAKRQTDHLDTELTGILKRLKTDDLEDNVDFLDEDSDSSMDEEYMKFILETRKHQKDRDEAKTHEVEDAEFYKDISQVNTLMELNKVDVPQSASDGLSVRLRERQNKMKAYYGSEQYDSIQSMQLHIDNQFQNECTRRNPCYWPVIPINMKFYLTLYDKQISDG